MPVEFLSDEQAAAFGRFVEVPSQLDLTRSCVLDGTARAVIGRHRGDRSRLGFAVQLATVRMLGAFLADPLDVPWEVVTFLADQLGMVDASVVKAYTERAKTPYEHQWEITQTFGYRPFADPAAQGELRTFLGARAWMSAEGPLRLFERSTAWLRQQKVLLPGVSVLARLVSEVRAEQADRLHAGLGAAAGPSVLARLERLLDVAEGERVSRLERLRTGPSRVSVPELLRQVDRLTQLRELGVNELDVSPFPAGRLNALARHGLAGKAPALRELSTRRRQATLLATTRALTAEVADDLCDALEMIVSERVIRRATRDSGAARLRSLPQLVKASVRLADAVQVMLEVLSEDTLPEQATRAVLAQRLNVPTLTAAVDAVRELVPLRSDSAGIAEEMMRRFTTVRAFLPVLADAAPFGATAGGAPALAALHALPAVLAQRRLAPSAIDLSVVAASWRQLVVTGAGEVDRRAWTLALTEALHQALRRRDVFVIGGRRWGDPRARLLPEGVWQINKTEVLTGLQLTERPDAHLHQLTARLDSAYRLVAAQLADSEAVRIDATGRVHLSPLESLPIPASLAGLRAVTAEMLPQVDLPEVLLEVHTWTGFLTEFSHVSEATARMDELGTSVAAVLIAEACNVGLTPVVSENNPALTRARLSHVDQNYLRAETLRAANNRLVEAQAGIELAQRWGGGLLASADGMRFVVPVATVNAGANPRYFGRGRGLTWLNYLNDQVAGIGAVVVPGTVRDSLHILDGLLDLDAAQRPQMLATDTASYADQIFGLFSLLGYRFSPRLADLPDQRFWHADPTADYGPLGAVTGRNRINQALIAANWPDMLRLAGSLATGTVRASDILRVTQGGGTPTLLGRAIAEYGRIAKTLHLLAFIDTDDTYRRQIHTQLTVQESRHALARRIFHGRRGQIHQHYREGQEDQLGALGLVLNAVVLWNTRYLDAALQALQEQEPVASTDIQRLSPLGSEHINMLAVMPSPSRQPMVSCARFADRAERPPAGPRGHARAGRRQPGGARTAAGVAGLAAGAWPAPDLPARAAGRQGGTTRGRPGPCCALVASSRSLPSPPTRSGTARTAAPTAADHRSSTPPSTRTAPSSSGRSTSSSSGAASRPATTSTLSSTAAASSWPRSCSGSDDQGDMP